MVEKAMKVLMLGLGGIGQRHVRNLRALFANDLEIIAFRQSDKSIVLTDRLQIEEGSILTDKYHIKVFPDYTQALDQNPDAVFICNPTSLHIPFALEAAQRGRSLFIEKPLSHSMEGVEELVQLVETAGVKAVIGYQLRFHPCLLRLRNYLRDQAIGRVLSVRAEVGEYLPGWHVYEDYRQGYAARKDLGGGVILSQIHELDYLYWLFGMPQSVYAVGGHLSSLDVDVEDAADLLMEYNVDRRPMAVSVHLDYVQRPPRRVCELVGDRGKISIDLRALTVKLWDRDGILAEESSFEGFERNEMFLSELRSFFEYIRGLPSSLPTIRDGAQSLRIALGAKEALSAHTIVTLREGTE